MGGAASALRPCEIGGIIELEHRSRTIVQIVSVGCSGAGDILIGGLGHVIPRCISVSLSGRARSTPLTICGSRTLSGLGGNRAEAGSANSGR
jgi:hypothetical protein